jgi:transposase
VFCQNLEAYRTKGYPLVFLDESGFAHDMPRTHGYAPKGLRCYGRHDWGAKGRTNVIGALLGGALLTINLFQTTINSLIFTQWVELDLVPVLPPKSVVIMDNAAFHKSSEMKEILHKAGHILLYLPPYSPDLNPIEHKWAQAKAIRRKYQCSLEHLFLNLST